MRRRVWCVDEIRDILVATNQASGSSAALAGRQEAEKMSAYREGFKAALVSVATALGMAPILTCEGMADGLVDKHSF
jgi:riboflavin biosynthesis pyrimidine reductase